LLYGGDPTLKIFPVDIRGWANSRLEAFGCTVLNGMDLSVIDIEDKIESKVGPARLCSQEEEDALNPPADAHGKAEENRQKETDQMSARTNDKGEDVMEV